MSAPTRDPIQLELFSNRFTAIARDMGEQLRRTAVSTNVKERLDFSCALLDPDGRLVVNAPHIPVHLGALGLCVRRLMETCVLEPGDVLVTNHPRFGGSHLPDITVVTPIFASDDSRRLGFAANRAHHAEIGGSRPGSMPPEARSLAEEGVVIPAMHLVRSGQAHWNRVEELLTSGPYPTRRPGDNLADLQAAVAANASGAAALRRLADQFGANQVAAQMQAIQQTAAEKLRAALGRWNPGVYSARERLDDGSLLQVHLEIRGGRLEIDFRGSSGVHPGNLNATPAIVYSVVLYVLRLLVGEPIPLNEGLLDAVTIQIPEGILSPPFVDDPARCPAVVGGNTETSQRLVDTLLKALGLAACSQGTMNNTLFGSPDFGYYETVGGGSGATSQAPGASAVQTHMTNTRITDPEVLETRFPVRLERFAIRRGSGGTGQHPGGDGIVREICFLAPLSVSVLTQHRAEVPYGLEGGLPGLPGRQHILRHDGTAVELAPVDGCEVQPGDRLILETPGGGGWGSPTNPAVLECSL